MGFPLFEVRMSTQSNGHFRGRFEIKVDPKFRLTLPAAFREVLESVTSHSRMVITNSQYQGKRCLDVYPFSEWKKLEGRISRLPQLKVEVQNFQRFYLSGGHAIEMDAQGRVLIPPTLRTYAGLQTEIVLVGFANKFEIWALDVWKGLFENLAQDFNQTLAAISDMDTPDD
jgi:MraZ protein